MCAGIMRFTLACAQTAPGAGYRAVYGAAAQSIRLVIQSWRRTWTRRAGPHTARYSGSVPAHVVSPSFELREPVLGRLRIRGCYRPAVLFLRVPGSPGARWAQCEDI